MYVLKGHKESCRVCRAAGQNQEQALALTRVLAKTCPQPLALGWH